MFCHNSEEEQQEESLLKFPCLWPNCFSLNLDHHDIAQFKDISKQSQQQEQDIEMKVITSEQDISRQSKVTLTPSNSNR